MARLELAGRAFDIAPYKLGALRVAAPLIDRINAGAASLNTMEGMTESASDIVSVISIGLMKIDPALSAEAVEEMVGFDDLPALRDCFIEVLTEAGLRSGEAKAPASDTAAAGASKQASETSSTS